LFLTFLKHVLKNFTIERQAYNKKKSAHKDITCYSGGEYWEGHGSRSAQAKSMRPYLKK
jgi:hypothetical protein